MNGERERFAAEIDGCGCCEGLHAATPAVLYNRPGLDAVSYRIGAHPSFKASLLAALSSSRYPELAGLRIREDHDFSIALIDAFSCMADVLTFYQERLANEAWLRTADERLSLRELARLIGYQLDPGVAADALLAFTLEAAPGAPADEVGRTTIAVGTRVQSTPGPDESPQIYETIEAIDGRVAWNEIRPPRDKRHPLTGVENPLYLEGLSTRIKPGDAVLYRKDGGGSAFGIVAAVEPRPELEHTEVTLSYVTASPKTGSAPDVQEDDPDLGPLAPDYRGETWAAADLAAEAEVEGFDADELLETFEDNPRPAPRVTVLRTRAAVFGHNAPSWAALPAPLKTQDLEYEVQQDATVKVVSTIAAAFTQQTWIDGKTLDDLDQGQGYVHLDSTYPGIAIGSTVVVRDGDKWAVYTVDDAGELSHADFNISAKVTRIKLGVKTALDQFNARGATVYGASEALALARKPRSASYKPNPDGWLRLEGWVPGLAAGQRVIVAGRAVGATDEKVSEAVVLGEIEYDLDFEGGTRIITVPELEHEYRRESVRVNANVALATHGESVEEVLGSGDARVPYQSFKLAQPPLTFVGAANASGRVSTLEIRVNDILWHEVETLYRRGPEERIFVTRQDDEGKTIVQFGDGVNGARLPSGTNNVRASYRKGIGLGGRVDARQLDVLLSRPLGLKSVVNPLPAEGGDDSETRDKARENAPLTVMTLDRAVSLQDYEDLARTYAGIDKALATWTWQGRRRSVFLTVAGAEGAEVPVGSTLYQRLVESLQGAGDPNVPLTVASYRKALFRLDADLIVDPDHLDEVVLEAAEKALREKFSFAARRFGQPVARSEVMATLQGVEGVVAVDLNKLFRTDAAETLEVILPADLPVAGSRGEVEAAEILFLDPAPLEELRVLE